LSHHHIHIVKNKTNRDCAHNTKLLHCNNQHCHIHIVTHKTENAPKIQKYYTLTINIVTSSHPHCHKQNRECAQNTKKVHSYNQHCHIVTSTLSHTKQRMRPNCQPSREKKLIYWNYNHIAVFYFTLRELSHIVMHKLIN